MARTDTLEHYLTDVADSIRAKTGESGLISADNFDIAISNIPSGGPSDIYRVATVQEMNALQNVEANSICVISTIAEGNWTATTSSSSITCPEIVELPEEYSLSSSVYFEDTDNTFQLTSYLQHSRFRLEGYGFSDPLMIDVQYTSEDGVHYTRGNFEAMNYQTHESIITGNTINLPVSLSCRYPEGFEPLVGYFMQTTQMTFDGIFTYNGSSWVPTNLGVNAGAGDILVGKSAYTNLGLTAGAFPQNNLTDLEKVVQAEQTQFSNIDSFGSAFSGSSYDIIAFSLDTSNMTSMASAFSGCNASIISIKNFDSSNVTTFHSMFESCQNLEILDVDLDVSSASGYSCFQRMFAFSPKLEYVNFHCDVKHSVLGMSEIARNCTKLKRLDMRNIEYDSSNASAGYIGYMFAGCTSLEYLDVRDIDFSMFTKAYSNYNTFGTNSTNRVPANCLIIVKDEASKNWLNTKCSWLTNVKTPSEL